MLLVSPASSRKHMSERGFRRTTSTNYSQWRVVLLIPSARVPETQHLVQFRLHTACTREPKYVSVLTILGVAFPFLVAPSVISPQRMPERGLRPTISTNCGQWRAIVHMPSAGDPSTGRSVSCWSSTGRKRELKHVATNTNLNRPMEKKIRRGTVRRSIGPG